MKCSYASGRATEPVPFGSGSEELGGPEVPDCGFRSDRSRAELLDDELVGVFEDCCPSVRPLDKLTGSKEPSSTINSVTPATLTLLPKTPSISSSETPSLFGT
ncbi:uncharacterized protein ColSpa_06692 [Colletotrichum spaethianum]|uniref:Uncharacterized protein n=1 Tax=Colletotrichum spaethianum TaxID=700344 RepID=A0AA37LD96_9PEZI|nr:uncharacterized protein ColSpa_06692 [Colletotrichum spaethianum]GKT46511.1 hypothetical protein ColSpa_06692 [Colletotrichum spaethianum]